MNLLAIFSSARRALAASALAHRQRRFWTVAGVASACGACNGQTLVAFSDDNGIGGSTSAINSCLVSGMRCQTNGDCCTGACADSGSHVLTCQPLDGCLPAGEFCSGSDCCSGDTNCVFDPTYAQSRCQLASGCKLPGELCQTNVNCCGPSKNMGGPGAPLGSCEVTDTGVSRCVMSSLGPTQNGGSCQFSEQCSGQHQFCLPTPNGPSSGEPPFQCASSCAAQQSPCNAPRDCCGGLTCVGNVCLPSSSNCYQLGVTCSQQADCCSGRCVAVPSENANTCQIPL